MKLKFLITGLSLFVFLFSSNLIDAQCNNQIDGLEFIGNFAGSDYYLSENLLRPSEAESFATSVGGHLVNISSEEENSFVAEQINSFIYIGLNDAGNEGNLIWTSNEVLDYTNFDYCSFCASNDPFNDFVIMHPWNGGWSFMNQWSKRNFMVEIDCKDDEDDNDEVDQCEVDATKFTPLGQFGNHNYYISNETYRPQEAMELSKEEGGYLFSISNALENNFIANKISEFVWIGLSDAIEEGNLVWEDASINSYSNFDFCSFCADNSDDFDYVLMHPWNGGWSFMSLWSSRKFILEVDCEQSDDEQSVISVNCPAAQYIIPQNSGIVEVTWDTPSASTNCSNSALLIENTNSNFPDNNGSFQQGSTYTIEYLISDNCGSTEICSLIFEIGTFEDNEDDPIQMVDYTANDQVTPYTGLFRPGANMGYNPPWSDEQLADLAAGNPNLGILGAGAKTIRPGMYDLVTSIYGYDFRLDTYDHFSNLGMDDLALIVGFPAEWHRDLTDYCGNGINSAMFRNLYTDIWDNGENGTAYNDENFYAAYLYEVVTRYTDQVKFWEIWNEPGFDFAGVGWREPGDPVGNWWDRDPSPCENILRAPIEQYIRTLRISWEIIKAVSPEDYVVVAGVGYESFLDAILRNTDNPNGGEISPEYPHGGGAYFDVMGFHSYPDIDGSVREFDPNTGDLKYTRNSDVAAAGMLKRKNSYENILANYGYGINLPAKEWIMTEFNVPRKAFKFDAMTGGDLLQVNYIPKVMVNAMKNDVRQIHIYSLGDVTTDAAAMHEFDNLGLYKRLDGTVPGTETPNEEVFAYKTSSDILFGTTYDHLKTTQMNLAPNLDGGAFRQENGQYVYVLWAKALQDQSEFATANYSFPNSFGLDQLYVRSWDFSKNNQTRFISSMNIQLNGSPIFLSPSPSFRSFSGRLERPNILQLKIGSLYPNPSMDEIYCLIESKKSSTHYFEIYDAKGFLISKFKKFLEHGISKQRINLNDYKPGVYQIILKDDFNNITTNRFTKINP